jgi:hypothetical protein
MFRALLDWLQRVMAFVDLVRLLIALGTGSLLKTVLATYLHSASLTPWLTPIWLLSSAAILWLLMRFGPNQRHHSTDGTQVSENDDADFEQLFLSEQDSRNKYQEEAARLRLEIEQLKTEATKPKPDPICDTLKEIAQTDAKKMDERVKQISQQIEFRFNPGTEPSFDVVTELWNGSVFDLANFREISGRATYAGGELAAAPRVIFPTESNMLSLKHGGNTTLIVRQNVSVDMANAIEAGRGRGMRIDMTKVAVRFDGYSPNVLRNGTVPEFRWAGPKFAIEDTARV